MKDASIDTNISPQDAAVCIGQDSIKYTVADRWGSRHFLSAKRKTGHLSGRRNDLRKIRHQEYITLQGSLRPGTMPTQIMFSLMS